MSSILEQLGVRPIINAAGPVTRLSGARMDADVIDAMREAARVCVDIAQMQAAAGQLIADITGAECGYVTSGAAGRADARNGGKRYGDGPRQDEPIARYLGDEK